jgi:hypothetical protein
MSLQDGRIVLETRVSSIAHLQQSLVPALTDGAELLREQPGEAKRGIDPTVLVALVGAGGTALGALLTGLFKVREVAKSGQLVIVGSSGRRLEIPAEASREDVDFYVQKAIELDIEKVVLDR